MPPPSTDNSLAKVVDEEEQELLDKLLELVKEEKNLSCPMDDVYLLRYLRYKKLDVEKAFQSVLVWWNDRHRLGSIHDGLYPSVYENVYEKGFSTTLAHRDHLGRQIILWRPEYWDPKETTFLELFKSNFCVVDTVSTRQETQLQGCIFLLDLSGLGMAHVQACTPSSLRILLSLTDGFPMRIKGIHFVNHPVIFNMVYAIAKTFMKPKMKKRVHFHGYNYASLHKHFSPEMLPKCYGGLLEGDEFKEEGFNQVMLSREQYFRDLFNTYGYNVPLN